MAESVRSFLKGAVLRVASFESLQGESSSTEIKSGSIIRAGLPRENYVL